METEIQKAQSGSIQQKKLSHEELLQYAEYIDRTYPFLQRIYKMIYIERRVVVIVIVGARGTGKSYTAIRLATLLDKDFNVNTRKEADNLIRERVVISPLDYVKLINNPNIHRGNVCIFDEAGVGLPAREWQSASNRIVGKLMQLFRHRGLIIILTVPSWNFVDVQVRETVDFLITTMKINRSENKVVCKIQEAPRHSKIENRDDTSFWPYLRSGGYRIVRNKFRKVPAILANAYEAYSIQFKTDLEKGFEKHLANPALGMQKKPKIDLKFFEDKIYREIDSYISMHNGKYRVSSTLIQGRNSELSAKNASIVRVRLEDRLKADGRELNKIIM